MSIRDNYGGKAEGLEWLVANQKTDKKSGYIIPYFDKIDFSFYIDSMKDGTYIPSPNLIKKAEELADKFKDKAMKVRSSSKREDGKHSFAGIYESETVLSPTKENILSAVGIVYDSMNSKKAIDYRKEHDIKDDLMGIIFQEYIDNPKYSGVMFTSNPSYPKDLTIELSEGEDGITSASKEIFKLDMAKDTGDAVFKSENIYGIEIELAFIGLPKKLLKIGKAIEKKGGPSDIEFRFKNGKTYLLQKRDITDIQEIEEITIPEYPEDRFIGLTNVSRGQGKLTLPIVKMSDIAKIVERPGLMMLHEETEKVLSGYFSELISKNKEYHKGYILLTEHFGDFISSQVGYFLDLSGEDHSIDSLTSNKKGVITTNSALRSSHIMTIARERGTLYAGFDHRDDIFDKLSTGDLVSMYIQGREAKIYLEERQMRYLKDVYTKQRISVEKSEYDNLFQFKMKDINTYKNIQDDVMLFLNKNTDNKWSFEPYKGVMGGTFYNNDKKPLYLNIGKCYDEFDWFLSRERWDDKESLSQEEFSSIVNRYAQHLKS